jgi:LysR family transcriptional regulator (chromosome initiation inhibitor)
VAAWPLLKARVEAGTLVLLRPDVRVPVDLHWHQWKLADTGDGSASPGLLDRIGAALAAGAPTDGPPDDCV